MVSDVGAGGRKLSGTIYLARNPNITGEFDIMQNGASSNYEALQPQVRHRFAHGLSALLSSTRAHAIDNISSDGNHANVPPGASSDRGSSAYDSRQTFSAAISYNIPAPGRGIWESIFRGWSTDSIAYAQTAPPVNVAPACHDKIRY
jgi:hypothetical protein